MASFIPIGFLLSLIKNNIRLKNVVIFGIALSVDVELMQLLGERGTCEFDDVFLNSLGCILGYIAARALVMVFSGIVTPVSEKE